MFVHCKPWQGDLRTGVRNTWGNRRLGDINGGSKVLFVVGRNDNYREEQRGRSAWEKELSKTSLFRTALLCKIIFHPTTRRRNRSQALEWEQGR